MDLQKDFLNMQIAYEKNCAIRCNCSYEELKAQLDRSESLFGTRYLEGSPRHENWLLWVEAWRAAKEQAESALLEQFEINNKLVEQIEKLRVQAIPDGFVLVKKRNMIGNPNVDFLQAPKWAKYWLKDGHSDKYWWSSIRPIKDMDLNAFCWKGDYFAEEALSFDFTGSWDKSLTSRKAMLEAAQEPAND